ncbi:MAG: hypothetical protein LBL82_01745 [Oscillospiraceae bacterium]|jgi:hypothetical protein|nr:hypothetical protein [Oscillospiraceae bacterium]
MSRVFFSCKFPKSDFAIQCVDYAKEVGIELFICDYKSPGDIHEKIRQEIFKSQAILFLLEDNKQDDGQITNFTLWMAEERDCASGRNLPMGIINYSSYENIPSVFDSNIEVLKKEKTDTVSTVAYLANFSRLIDVPFVPSTTFSRNYLRHKVELKMDGSVKYSTTAEIVCLAAALNDFSHSIYTQYSPCWNTNCSVVKPEIRNYCDDGRKLEIKNFVQNEQKFNWTYVLSSPLKKNDVFKYGFVVEFPEYFPASKEKLKEMVECPGYPFFHDRVEHHYFINTQTKALLLELLFEDKTVAKDFKVIAYSSRQYCEDCVDHGEIARIENSLKKVDSYGEVHMQLEIPNPKTGYTYSISWKVEENKK